MKKRIFAVILSALMIFMFAGCSMVIDLTTNVKKNGSGSMTMIVGLDEELWNMVSSDESADTEDYKELDYYGETIYGNEETITFGSYEELNSMMVKENVMQDALGEDGGNGAGLFESFEASKSGITGVLATDGLGLGDDMDTMKEAGVLFKFPLRFTFEDEVIEANGRISEDKHTVTYDMLTDKEINIKLKNQNLLPVFIAIGAAVIIAATAAVCIGKKKKAAEAISASEETSAADETAVADASGSTSDESVEMAQEAEKAAAAADETAVADDATVSEDESVEVIPAEEESTAQAGAEKAADITKEG